MTWRLCQNDFVSRQDWAARQAADNSSTIERERGPKLGGARASSTSTTWGIVWGDAIAWGATLGSGAKYKWGPRGHSGRRKGGQAAINSRCCRMERRELSGAPRLFCIGSTEPQPSRDGDKPKPRSGDQEETPLYKIHRGRPLSLKPPSDV